MPDSYTRQQRNEAQRKQQFFVGQVARGRYSEAESIIDDAVRLFRRCREAGMDENMRFDLMTDFKDAMQSVIAPIDREMDDVGLVEQAVSYAELHAEAAAGEKKQCQGLAIARTP